MTTYAKYDNSTGEILCILSIPDSELRFYEGDFIECSQGVNRDTHYVSNNVLLEKPAKESNDYIWDTNNKVWIYSQEAHFYNLTQIESQIKQVRLQLLQESDWTDTISAIARLGEEKYNEWQTYRQALRDVTQQSGYPVTVIWPEKPSTLN